MTAPPDSSPELRPSLEDVRRPRVVTPILSLVIVSWNTCRLLDACLSSIAAATGEALRGAMELFVVDNGSSDGSPQMVQERFPWVTLLCNDSNVGFARANNQAISLSKGKYVLLLNSDTEVLPGALERLVAFMAERPQAGAAGALLLNADGSLQPSAQPMLTPGREFWRLSFLDSAFPRATYRMETWDRQAPRRVEVLKGAALLLRRAALDEVGLLDEAYFMYTEEVDLCYRLAEAAWELWWVPGAQILHHGEASSRQAAEEMYIALYRSKVQFYRKFGGERRAARFKQLLRLAYWPRTIVATLLAGRSAGGAARMQTLRRLLAELPAM